MGDLGRSFSGFVGFFLVGVSCVFWFSFFFCGEHESFDLAFASKAPS